MVFEEINSIFVSENSQKSKKKRTIVRNKNELPRLCCVSQFTQYFRFQIF
jgi:hypothetical protein